MKILSTLAVAILLSLQMAHADEFAFNFSTSAEGCSLGGGCTTTVEGSGTFFTDPLSTLSSHGDTDIYGGTQTYLITDISGQMNGAAMNFVPGNFASVWQEFPAQGAAGYDLFNFYPTTFTVNGTTWQLWGLEPYEPPGTSGLLLSPSGPLGSDLNLTVAPVAMPEPSSVPIVVLALLTLLVVMLREKWRVV